MQRLTKLATTSILVFAALLLIPNFSQAQQINASAKPTIGPGKKALIKEYFEVTGGREAVREMFEICLDNSSRTIERTMSAAIEQDNDLTSEQKAEILKTSSEKSAQSVKKFREELKREVDFGELVEDITYPLLDKFFTERELKDLIAFYRSPTGKKTISVQPQFFQDAITRLNAVLTPAMQKAMAKVSDVNVYDLLKNAKDND